MTLQPIPTIMATLALGACSTSGVMPVQAELANIKGAHVAPKSTPAQFVNAFRDFCVEGDSSPSARAAKLRAASYVPAQGRPDNGITLYLVDDRRPAVAVSNDMCLVQAVSRTGQTERARRYISEAFPTARPSDPTLFAKEIEEVWEIPGASATSKPDLVATMRSFEPTPTSRYALIYFTPGRQN